MGVSVVLIDLSSALVHDVNFNGFFIYSVLPCELIVIWFQAVAVFLIEAMHSWG